MCEGQSAKAELQMTQVVFRSLLYPRAKQAACFVVIQKYVASTAAAKWSAMPLTLQV